MNRRKFPRYKFTQHIQYKKVNITNDNLIDSLIMKAISKDLSHSGIRLTTADPPKISDLLMVRLKTHPTMEIIGKVVRLEDIGGGQCDVSIAFVQNTHKAIQEIEHLIRHTQHHRITLYLLKTFTTLFILLIASSIFFVHTQYRKIFVPGDRMITLTPTSIDLPFEDIYFKTADGEVINGWFLPAEGAQATVIYCHGNEGNMTDRLARLNFLHKIKMNSFIFDYRGYGKSTGSPSEEGLYKDAQGAYDYILSRKEIAKTKIIIWGVSLGGAVAADLCLHRKAHALILESTFVSLLIQAKDLYPYFPVDLFVHDEFDTIAKIKNINIPKLISHGVDDEAVLFKHARFLFDDAPYPKEFLPFHGGHSDDVYILSDTYKNELFKFLLRYKIINSTSAALVHS